MRVPATCDAYCHTGYKQTTLWQINSRECKVLHRN